MKTGVNTGTIIDVKKQRKRLNIRPLKCNCKICVNNSRNGCRFNWEPINGKCNRFGKNDYKLTREEREEAKKRSNENKEKIKKEHEIKYTTLKVLSKALETTVTMEMLKKCTSSRALGNGKYLIKCTDTENMIISIKKNRTFRRFKVLDI